MARKRLAGKKYFYAIGQSVRAKGFTKTQGEILYQLDAAPAFARIAFDKGYRGFGL